MIRFSSYLLKNIIKRQPVIPLPTQHPISKIFTYNFSTQEQKDSNNTQNPLNSQPDTKPQLESQTKSSPILEYQSQTNPTEHKTDNSNTESIQTKSQPNRFFSAIKSAWQQTFPNEEDEVRNKYTKIKQQKHYTKEQIEKMQSQIPQYQRTALTETQHEAVEQKKSRFTISKLIPESVKKKVTESESYKELNDFKANLKEYASTRDGAVANVATMAYGAVANDSPTARATSLMRKFIPSFNIFDFEKESTVIFKDAYNTFLQGDLEKLQKMANEQALEYFKAHLKLNKTKKQTFKYTEIVFHYPARYKKAHVGEKLLPTFEFDMKIMEIYCMVNEEGEVVDGDLERVNESIFEFTVGYSGNHLKALGHPWELVEIKKIQEMKLLV